MATATNQFPPIDHETRSHVETACAAFHLNRKQQTMRAWASTGNGAIRPVRIMGRLAWPVEAIKHVLKCGATAGAGAAA